jgi:hypothetical protein
MAYGPQVLPEFLVKHISDVNGVLFEVAYSRTPPVEIRSIHLLDASYRPIGPDLTHLLHELLIMTTQSEAERFISKLIEELP